jgi:hypothetical protein
VRRGALGRREIFLGRRELFKYPLLNGKAQRILIPFATSYLGEAGFSAVAVIKSKYRAKINMEQEMRVAVSSLIPRFEKMCSEQQAHPSHLLRFIYSMI